MPSSQVTFAFWVEARRIFVPALAWTALGFASLLAVACALDWIEIGGLAQALGLLTLFVGAITLSFSSRYMRADTHPLLFQLRVAALIASVLVFLFSSNLIAIGLGWIASGRLLARLIGHSAAVSGAAASSRRASRSFLIGDAALVVAFIILTMRSGDPQLASVLPGAGAMPATVAEPVALLLLVAAAVRCALPPFSGWLLSSMTAPTPVSALMHAGLVNAGGFLLIRFAPIIEAAPLARLAALVVGLCAAIYGIGIMMVRPDVKSSLAGSTISQMGFMIISCGLGAYAAALWHIVAHGLFKAWLFLGAGSAIGMKAPNQTVPQTGHASLIIAAATLGVAMLLIWSGHADAGIMPLMLGLATAAVTLSGSLEGELTMRARLTLISAIGALIVFQIAGIALAREAVGPDASALMPSWAAFAMLAAFLGTWIWQQQSLTSGRALPMRLYVHLINAGSFPATGKGVTQ